MTINSTALRGGLLLLPLLAQAAAAQAEDAAPDEVTVTGHQLRADEAVRQTPGGADLVDGEEFDGRLAVSLRDALAFSPGVYAQQRFGQEVRLSIRGSGIGRDFHMRGLTLLQDGVPINLADDNGNFQELDPLVLDRIEVFRGGNALRFGGSTLGGAVNGITPAGHDAPGLDLRIDGGSFDTLRGKAAFGASGDQADAWFALTGDTSDGDRQHAKRDSLRFHGNVAWRPSDRVETHLLASAQTIDQQLPGALNLADAIEDPAKGNFAGDQQRNIDSLRLQNRTHVEIRAGLIELGGFVNLKDLFHPIFQVVDQQSTDWGAFARLSLARGPFDLTLGSTARFGTMDSRRFVNVNGKRGALTFEAALKAHTIDVYGEARYRFGDASLIAGGIYTHARREQRQRFPAAVTGEAEFDQVSPKLGLLWQADDDVQLYANFSRSHELPGFIELAQVAAFVPLKAQKAWTAEAGARGRIGVASFDVTLYRAMLRGELLQFTVGPDIPASTFNADRTLHQGIEAGLDLDLLPWLRLRQVYQLNDFRFRDDAQYGDNRLPVIPRHLYRAELRLGDARRHVSPVVEWVPQGAWVDYRNSLRAEGYAMLGVSGEVSIDDRFTLFADMRNITGKKAVGDIGAVVAATPASVIFYPVERRALYAGVRAKL